MQTADYRTGEQKLTQNPWKDAAKKTRGSRSQTVWFPKISWQEVYLTICGARVATGGPDKELKFTDRGDISKNTPPVSKLICLLIEMRLRREKFIINGTKASTSSPCPHTAESDSPCLKSDEMEKLIENEILWNDIGKRLNHNSWFQ